MTGILAPAHDHGHGHGHDHGHGHHDHDHGPSEPSGSHTLRYVIAAVLVVLAVLAASVVTVRAGSATVVTRFGDPVRVLTVPGLTWKTPAPIERTVTVDLRLATTASGIHGVLTKDGLSVLVQAHVAWKVPADSERIVRFLRAVQNRPEEAANQLRTFLGSSLETVTSRFELAQLVNTDPAQVKLVDYEAALRERLETQARDMYGIEVVSVGLERLMLPEATVAATIQRMSAERETVAETKKADGRRIAGEIRSGAEKDARITRAKANEEASQVEAQSRAEAAGIYGKVQAQDPQLYEFLRSLDTLDQSITGNTRLILRTDSVPFRHLVEAPVAPSPAPAPAKQP